MKDRQEIAIDLYRACYNEFLHHEDYLAAADLLLTRIETNEKKYNSEGLPLEKAFEELRKLVGSNWDDVICVCSGLVKDEPCNCNCKEFHDESLPNRRSELQLAQQKAKS